MPGCSVCRGEVPEEQLVRCTECGKAHRKGCAGKDPSMKALGICSDCEESSRARRTTEAGSRKRSGSAAIYGS